MERIVSLQNSKIKNIQKLASKSRERQDQGLFIIEGAREMSLALAGSYVFDSIFICQDLFVRTAYPEVLAQVDSSILFEVTEAIFQKIAYREGSDGLLALAKPKSHTLTDLYLPPNPFVIVLEAVEKPGNLGAILRTADAAGVDAVIICDPQTDLYNPNTVRSGVGCLFTVQTAVCFGVEAEMYLKSRKIQLYAAELKASQWYQDTDFRQASAVIFGTEADGLSSFWLERADTRIKIPMRGKIDSLNVSVSAAVITFEAMRQRGF